MYMYIRESERRWLIIYRDGLPVTGDDDDDDDESIKFVFAHSYSKDSH